MKGSTNEQATLWKSKRGSYYSCASRNQRNIRYRRISYLISTKRGSNNEQFNTTRNYYDYLWAVLCSGYGYWCSTRTDPSIHSWGCAGLCLYLRNVRPLFNFRVETHKRIKTMFIETQSFTAEYWAGWLVITDRSSNETYPVQLRDTKTGRNITRKQFNSAIKTHGTDRACQTFCKLYALPSTPCYS